MGHKRVRYILKQERAKWFLCINELVASRISLKRGDASTDKLSVKEITMKPNVILYILAQYGPHWLW